MSTMRSVLEYLEQDAALRGDRCAVTDKDGSCTYAELCALSRRVGSALLARESAQRPVIVFMEKGIPMLSAFLGALYAGGFYVPVDPSTPAERAARIRRTMGPGAVVVSDGVFAADAARAFPHDEILRIEELGQEPSRDADLDRMLDAAVDTDPAYVLFTSGSTGEPKGVAVSHRAVIDFIDSFTELFGLNEGDVIGNQAPFDFDVSVKDIYGALAVGAELRIVPRELFSQPAALLDCLNESRVSVLIWAAAALCLVSGLRGLEYAGLPRVRLVMMSGEVMPLAHLRRWMDRLPHARFVNLYGPTEICCNCLFHMVSRSRRYEGAVPLGRPLPNRRVLLLDRRGQLVEKDGEVGEIYVGGSSVALGYYGDPERTAAAFVQSPLTKALPERLYRSGDLARWEDGELVFCGRVDNQIKYRGHRIELEEIDAAFERQEGVERCRCAYDERHQQIRAFYEGTADPERLRTDVARYLPLPMIPAVIAPVASMPLSKNGKVDRRALLDLRPYRRR